MVGDGHNNIVHQFLKQPMILLYYPMSSLVWSSLLFVLIVFTISGSKKSKRVQYCPVLFFSTFHKWLWSWTEGWEEMISNIKCLKNCIKHIIFVQVEKFLLSKYIYAFVFRVWINLTFLLTRLSQLSTLSHFFYLILY